MAYAVDLENLLLTTSEAADELGVSQATVQAMCERGELVARRVNTKSHGYRWYMSALSIQNVNRTPFRILTVAPEILENCSSCEYLATVAELLRTQYGDLTREERVCMALKAAGRSERDIAAETGLHRRAVQRRIDSAAKKIKKSLGH